MKLHKILLRHCSPKDQVEVTKLYVLANSESEILARLDASRGEYTYGAWKERSDDAEEPFEIYDENYNVVGTETYLEKMLRLRGEFNYEDADYSDAYYGVSHWGWDEGSDISEEDAVTLLRLGIAEDWRFDQSSCVFNTGE
jgi:hypothetical protein